MSIHPVQAHFASIKSVLLEVFPEPNIFELNCVLLDGWESDACHKACEHGHCRGYPERMLPSLKRGSGVVLYHREDVSADEGADLAPGCSDAVVLATIDISDNASITSSLRQLTGLQ